MKRKIYILIVGLIFFNTLSFSIMAAINCPQSQQVCYAKIIWKRDVGTGGLTEAERAILEWYIPNHHDYSVVKIDNGAIVEESTTGFFADNGFGVVIALFILNPFNEVDGTVRPSEDTKGSVIVSKAFIEETEYIQRQSYNEGIKWTAFPDCYNLAGDNCTGYAGNMYSDGVHGLE